MITYCCQKQKKGFSLVFSGNTNQVAKLFKQCCDFIFCSYCLQAFLLVGYKQNKAKTVLVNLFCADNQVLLAWSIKLLSSLQYFFTGQFLCCAVNVVRIIKTVGNSLFGCKCLFFAEHFLGFSEKRC